MEKDKQKNVENALKEIEKMYGKGAVMKLGEQPKVEVDSISTGSMLIDDCLGIGGIPKGRIVEIYGVESSGKSTLCLQLARECQRKGGVVAYIDSEHAMNPEYAEHIGVNTDELIFSQPDSGEQALEIAEKLVKSGGFDLIIIDSVAALTPQAELDGEMGDQNIGLLARLMSKAMRKLAASANQNGCSIVFINQLREKIGVMYGNPETTTGGRALKFYSSVRIEMRKGEPIKNGSEIIGNKAKVKIAKNKVAIPFKSCEVDLIYGEGFSLENEIVEMAVKKDIIHKAGSWFSYGDEKIGQGADSVRSWLSKFPDKKQEVMNKLKNTEFDPETGEIL